MPAFRSVVSVLVRSLGDSSLLPQGRPCGRPPAAAVLGRQAQRLQVAGLSNRTNCSSVRALAWLTGQTANVIGTLIEPPSRED
jgi:hypothetical protein